MVKSVFSLLVFFAFVCWSAMIAMGNIHSFEPTFPAPSFWEVVSVVMFIYWPGLILAGFTKVVLRELW